MSTLCTYIPLFHNQLLWQNTCSKNYLWQYPLKKSKIHFWHLIFKVYISDKILRSRILILYITLQFNPIYIFKYINLLLLKKSPPPAKKTKKNDLGQIRIKIIKQYAPFRNGYFLLSMQHFVYAFRNIYTLYWYITF